MSVLFTVGVIAVVALWLSAVLRQLTRMRHEIRLVWQRLEADQANVALKSVYNKHVSKYNTALDSFPAYVVAPLFGLKPARHFN